MADDHELLAKLERWVAEQPKPPTLWDALASRDVEIFAAFVLVRFRTAARRAATLERVEASMTDFSRGPAGNAVLRVFDGLARRWALTNVEEVVLLGLQSPTDLAGLRSMDVGEVPAEVVERVAILVDIFTAINTLLPVPARADSWMRAHNKAAAFGGNSALTVMGRDGLEGMRRVRAYLQAEVAGN